MGDMLLVGVKCHLFGDYETKKPATVGVA